MFYKYKVKYWNPNETREENDSGLVHASNYGNAATRLVAYFGEEYIIDMYLCEWDCENVISRDEIELGFCD